MSTESSKYSVVVHCVEWGDEKKADKSIKYGDIGKPPKNAVLGKISNCPKCNELYGYMWLKWHDRHGNAL